MCGPSTAQLPGRPYAVPMGANCDRTGCSRPAQAAVSLDLTRKVVWVGDLPDRAGGEMRMCDPCADALTAPLGWDKRDVREPSPRLFVVQPGDETREQAPLRPRTRRPAAEPETPLRLLDAEDGEQVEPALAAEAPIGSLMDPPSPLLARAFRGARLN